jgi:hypothetical protein
VKTITREQLKEKIDRGDDFVLVDALGEEYYRHNRTFPARSTCHSRR